MVITYEISTEHVYQNLTVYSMLNNGVIIGWRINANKDYVFYDTNANDTEPDPETGDEIPVTHYYTVAYKTATFNWDTFSLVTVPRDGVDKNYIHDGGGDNDY